MKITDFSKLVAQKEGLKEQVSIAQIKEILKHVNTLTDGKLYSLVRQINS